ncbi:MAG: M1 family peptidase, partial [Polaribacter sp.]
MKFRNIFLLNLLLFSASILAQSKTYRAEKEKKHNLIHTKLNVDFNFDDKSMNGEAWITAKPHFYATNTIALDANAMLIHEVSLNNK